MDPPQADRLTSDKRHMAPAYIKIDTHEFRHCEFPPACGGAFWLKVSLRGGLAQFSKHFLHSEAKQSKGRSALDRRAAKRRLAMTATLRAP
jgi:hypothetical protein